MHIEKELNIENGENQPLDAFVEKAYLEYSMYVILDRALPHIGDGLKPVQRRIVYAMSELGLKGTAQYKKSARTVGDVLGKFHPHGDAACYEAMVLMAQPFSYRYPLVDGQGNWGSPDDPKSFAAMRYTESKLSSYTQLLLEELSQGTVEWIPNFDGSLTEPAILPARVPNLLLNGTTGIAVGMATDIPSHNLKEVVEACIYLLNKPNASIEDLCAFIKGPDFPTNAEIITSHKDIVQIYSKGTGSLKMRAVFYEENGDIVITSLPYQVSGAKILEQIASQMNSKKLPMVADLRDESDHEEPTRLVIIPKSNRVNINDLMNHLFATTDLEKSYRVNMNIIGLDGNPQVKDLKVILSEWLEFRQQTVTKRLSHRLAKVNDRIHLLDGFLIVFLNIDEVIKIIRDNDKPGPVLQERFGLTQIQSDAILDLRLRQIAKIEEIQIKKEKDKLEKEKDQLEKILGSEVKLKTLIRKELMNDAKKYGDDRRSPLVERQDAQPIKQVELIASEPITVILSKKDWVRAAKGHEIDAKNLNYKAGDGFKTLAFGKTTQLAVFLDKAGRSFSLPAHTLPSARSQGEPLSGRFNTLPKTSFKCVIMGEPDHLILMASDSGYGFITSLSELYTKNKAGKAVITLPESSQPMDPVLIHDIENELIVAISNEGRMLLFSLNQLPKLSKGKGNKIISILPKKVKEREDYVAFLLVISPDDTLVIYTAKRSLTLTPGNLEQYMGTRGRRGQKLPRGFQNVKNIEIITPESTANNS